MRTAIVILAALAIFAEISPEEYRKMQQASPDVVYIQVSSVDLHRHIAKGSGCSWWDFEMRRDATVEARVLDVVRTASGLRRGATITIKYTSIKRCYGWNGARSNELLQPNERVYAFLQRDAGGVYVPAARGASFSSTPSRL
jgi:hypothetical protein